MKSKIEQYLNEILKEKKILGVSFVLKKDENILLEIFCGTPTTNSTMGLLDLAFKDCQSKEITQEMLYNKHEYVQVKDSVGFVFSYVATSAKISEIELKHIVDYLILVIRDFYLLKQKNRLQDDIDRLWDIFDSSIKHYINNELFTALGKCDIVSASGDIQKVLDIKIGINSVLQKTEKLFNQKQKVISDCGIIDSKLYYKDNYIISIDE